MADRGNTHYSLKHLNQWFLWSSVLLLVVTVWMVIDDYSRPWKQYQRRFREIEIERAREDLSLLEEAGVLATEEELQAAAESARTELESRGEALAAAEEDYRLERGEWWRLNEGAKKAKAGYNWDRFQIEVARTKADDPTLDADRLAAVEEGMIQSAFETENAEVLMKEAEAEVDALRAEVKEAETALSSGTRDLEKIRALLDQLAPEGAPEQIAMLLRDDIPGLDFIGPTIKVRKELPPNLTFELNFTKKARIDMCQTCHMAIDREGMDDVEAPFQSHPRLDLYLTGTSPHPIKDFGCTICHRGSGEALDFVRADHRPSSAAQEEEWAEEHHWHKQKYWDYPMLSSESIESSCVQCHKTSMELIAADAPSVFKGYELFEKNGCYACHKLEWFPTVRRPGPTLRNFQAKFGSDFLASWIADPRGFRPTTWMPQIFHLENFGPEEVIAQSRYGEGRDILGQEWNATAVAAVAAFLLDTAPRADLPPIPVEGDAHRGREVMRVTGCFACHNVAPWGEEPKTLDPTLVRRGENEHGPNLRGVGSKVRPEWLFQWIKDPSSLWSETRMPNLRLSDQDAADITSYVTEDPDGIFTDVPEGWISAPSPSDLEALQEQARWLFARDGRATIERRLNGEDSAYPWDQVGTLAVAVGEKFVEQYGCFSCHEINGMEDMMPIGTEVTNWGSKTVEKLDFGFAYQKDLGGRPELDHHYREGWLKRKLGHPRSFDLEKVKNPLEKLKMGWFDFSEDEIDAIATFVVGLVDDEVQRAAMVPSAEASAMDFGQRVVRQKNCRACHSIDPGTVTFRDEDGIVHTVESELVPFEDQPLPPRADGITAYLEEWAEEDGIEEVGFRLLRTEPGIGGVGSRVFVPLEDFLGAIPASGGGFVEVITDYLANGGIEMFDEEAEDEDDAYYYVTADPDDEGAIEDVDGEFRTYFDEPYDKIRWTFAPPVLWNEGHKVRPEWFYAFLKDVQPIRPQIRVRMPSFHFDEGEAEAVADYFALKSVQGWPAKYARALRASLELSAEDLGSAAGELKAEVVLAIENGSKAKTKASFESILELGAERGFSIHGAMNPSYEAKERRSITFLTERRASLGKDPLAQGRLLAVDAVNCFQCHFNMGQPPPDAPIAWAPDLAIVSERLREDWVHEWLIDPQTFYPGTSMPGNFSADPPQYQDKYPDSTNDDQLQAVLDWLYNLDQPDVLDRSGAVGFGQ